MEVLQDLLDDRIRGRLDTALLRHKTDPASRMRQLGRKEACLIQNGAGFSVHAGDDGGAWIVGGGRGSGSEALRLRLNSPLPFGPSPSHQRYAPLEGAHVAQRAPAATLPRILSSCTMPR